MIVIRVVIHGARDLKLPMFISRKRDFEVPNFAGNIKFVSKRIHGVGAVIYIQYHLYKNTKTKKKCSLRLGPDPVIKLGRAQPKSLLS